MNRILRFALGLLHTVIKSVRIDADEIVISVRPHKRHQRKCPLCGHKCETYDAMPKPRRWRALDLARSKCFLEYRLVRVKCPVHGVHVESVPWARHKARFTRDFEDRVAWMMVHCTASAVSFECRIEWHSVGEICARVYADLEKARGQGRFDGLRRIGIDETSHKKGHKYLTVVVDHDRGCLIWVGEGFSKDVVNRFLDELTCEQRRAIEVVSADGVRWLKTLVKRRCPNAKWVMDPFHVVSWMNDALNNVRIQEWQVAKKNYSAAARLKYDSSKQQMKSVAPPSEVKALEETVSLIKGSRFALLKNPENHTKNQAIKLAELKRCGTHLFKAWQLKEDLRAVFKAKDATEATFLLDDWLKRSSYSKIPGISAVRNKIKRRRDDIISAVALGISNARVEAINNKIKVTIKMGYGFRNIDSLTGLLMLRCSDIKPQLPGRKPSSVVDEKKAA
jgi:transposase